MERVLKFNTELMKVYPPERNRKTLLIIQKPDYTREAIDPSLPLLIDEMSKGAQVIGYGVGISDFTHTEGKTPLLQYVSWHRPGEVVNGY